MHQELLHQLALTMVPNVGAVQAKILVEQFGSAEDIFKARKKDLDAIEGIGEIRAAAIKHFHGFAEAEAELEFIEKYKISTLFLTDKNYPQRLLNCYDSPTLLFYRGNADLNASRIISIIGTRHNTDYGKMLTDKLVSDLQPMNVTIVSGLAYGIDALAHKAAVQNGTTTIGVLAHGLDTIYPLQHASLAKQMLANGGLLSEFRKNTKPDKHNFPKRNRIVAGMADATIVIETPVKGGSIITAELANGYNKDVFAYPGRTNDVKSAGCNQLIRTNKAMLLNDTIELIEMLGWDDKKVKPKKQKELFIELSPDEKILIDVLQDKDVTHIDELYIKSGLNSSSVAAALLNLEFQNLVASLPGKTYRLN